MCRNGLKKQNIYFDEVLQLSLIHILRPTIIMLTMMAIGRIFYSDFGLFYQVPMNQGEMCIRDRDGAAPFMLLP